jgi:PilZ domain-containing protein
MPPAPVSLAAGDQVQLTLPYVGALPARVQEASGTTVTVVLAVGDPRVARLAGREASLERTSTRGVHRYTGDMRRVAGEIVTFVVTGEPERVQRRDWARVEAVLPVEVDPLERSATGGKTTTLNVSAGGLLVLDPWRLVVGTDVRIALELPTGAIRALCRVVRDAGDGRTGMAIDDLERDHEDRLVRYVRERERAELRLSRGGA